MKYTSTEARIDAPVEQLKVCSQPEEGDVNKKEGETPSEPAWGEIEGILE